MLVMTIDTGRNTDRRRGYTNSHSVRWQRLSHLAEEQENVHPPSQRMVCCDDKNYKCGNGGLLDVNDQTGISHKIKRYRQIIKQVMKHEPHGTPQATARWAHAYQSNNCQVGRILPEPSTNNNQTPTAHTSGYQKNCKTWFGQAYTGC